CWSGAVDADAPDDAVQALLVAPAGFLGGMVCGFFFQAEDGIRDKLVTGVQTCALPISRSGVTFSVASSRDDVTAYYSVYLDSVRSEERRVGKECRSRGSAESQKKKKHQAKSVISAPTRTIEGTRSGCASPSGTPAACTA